MPDHIGPPLTNDAHWLKFVRMLRRVPVDEAIIAQLEEFRRLGKLVTGLELTLKNSEAEHTFWFDADAGIYFAAEHPGDTLPEALEKLVKND